MLGRHDVGQVEKEQVPEVGPHPGAAAADIGAIRAGFPAQGIHYRENGFQAPPDLMSLNERAGHAGAMFGNDGGQAVVGFGPCRGRVPGHLGGGASHGPSDSSFRSEVQTVLSST